MAHFVLKCNKEGYLSTHKLSEYKYVHVVRALNNNCATKQQHMYIYIFVYIKYVYVHT